MIVRQLSDRLAEAWRERRLALKALSFGAVGVVNTLFDLGLFVFAYYFLGWSIIFANVLAWAVAVSVSYVLNSMVTFAAESGRKLTRKAYAAFVLLQVGGLLANTATVFIAAYFVPVWAGKILAIGASFAVNFSLANFIVFRRATTPDDK